MKQKTILTPIIAMVCGLLVTAKAQQTSAPAEVPSPETKPYAHVQILNGISPHKVTLSINGQPLYPGLGPGARISSFGVPLQEWTLDVAKDGSDAVKNFKLKFPRDGFYTVVLTGDFAELPPVAGPDGTKKPDYRVKAAFLANKKPEGDSVDVRIVNGVPNQSVRLLRGKQEQCVALPGESATAANQPADLFVEAVSGETKIPLYIAQEPPASNITIVFYQAGQSVGSRAMTEVSANAP
jgi:hypothetical protein